MTRPESARELVRKRAELLTSTPAFLRYHLTPAESLTEMVQAGESLDDAEARLVARVQQRLRWDRRLRHRERREAARLRAEARRQAEESERRRFWWVDRSPAEQGLRLCARALITELRAALRWT
jgi:hypothetical protein